MTFSPFRAALWVLACSIGILASCAGNPNTGTHDEPPRSHRSQTKPILPFATLDEMRAMLDGDIAVELRGQGWYCFQVTGHTTASTFCRRTLDLCNDSRTVQLARKESVSACQAYPQAFCVRGKQRTDGFDWAKCSTSSRECESDRQLYQRYSGMEFVSDCERLP